MIASLETPAGPIGRYAIYDEIAAGGMATVHLGRLVGPVGFGRTVAIKRLHPHLAREPEVVAMFLDEARLAARVRHPNVVPTLDIVTAHAGPPFLVMEYVQGESLARLLDSLRARGQRVSVPVACSIVVGMLHGLHAAHEAKGEREESLGIVHRDVSPQNVIVGRDGVARLLDFGVAMAVGRLQTTREGQFKGKLAYTAPEIARGGKVTPAADIYSAAVVFWEALTGERLFVGDNDANVLERVLFAAIAAPSQRSKDVPAVLDPVVLRPLARDPARRFSTAREMARAIEAVVPVATRSEVGEWVEGLAGEALTKRASTVARIERGSAEPLSGDPIEGSGESLAFGPTSGPGAAASNDIEANASEPRPPPSRGRIWSALATCTLVATGSVVALGMRSPGAQSPSRVDRLAPGSSMPAPPSTPPPQAASPATVEPPTFAADDLPTAAMPPPSALTRGPRPHPLPVGKAASRDVSGHELGVASGPGGSPPAGRSPCDPPWNIDSRGIKQYKVECL